MDAKGQKRGGGPALKRLLGTVAGTVFCASKRAKGETGILTS